MTGRPTPPPRQRIAARLLLACCTAAVGLGLGTALAVRGVLDLQHPRLTVRSPGQQEGRLDRGVHELFAVRNAPDGDPPLTAARPSCTVVDVRTGDAVPAATAGAGFAAVRVARAGPHRVDCASALPVTVEVAHEPEGLRAYLAALGRGLVPAVALTVLAAVFAARALVTLRRLASPEA